MSTTAQPDLNPLKARHRAMWALGHYDRVADRLIPELGEVLTLVCGLEAGDTVLDVAAGTGNFAVPAARTGAHVTATDLTPELLHLGRDRPDAAGLAIDWQPADAEALPFADATFDVVVSAVGVMFAPFHEAAAAELARVLRPGGRLGLINWTPTGFIGQMFAAMKPYAPPPPAGATPPPRWGDDRHVRDLLGESVDLRFERRTVRVNAFETGAAFRDFFKECYGPTIVVFRAIADEPAKVAALDDALAALGDEHLRDGAMDWEYLLVTGIRK